MKAERLTHPLVSISWHGGPSFTLELAGLEVLIDPSFSRPGDYPPWFDERSANPHAPDVEAYLRSCRPRYLFVTHGHFDHFDLRTVGRLAEVLDLEVAGSEEVVKTCRDELGLDRVRTLTDGEWVRLAASVRVRAVAGPHWFTGEEGTAVARKFAGRPERFGAMPCGGPMLGLVFEIEDPPGAPAPALVYVSGDTEPHGLPKGPFDVAVVCCGGMLVDPTTKNLVGPYLPEDVLVEVTRERLRPRVLVPVHYDHPVFQTPFDPELVRAELGRAASGAGQAASEPPEVIIPPYNEWTVLLR